MSLQSPFITDINDTYRNDCFPAQHVRYCSLIYLAQLLTALNNRETGLVTSTAFTLQSCLWSHQGRNIEASERPLWYPRVSLRIHFGSYSSHGCESRHILWESKLIPLDIAIESLLLPHITTFSLGNMASPSSSLRSHRQTSSQTENLRKGWAEKASVWQASTGSGKNPPSDPGGKQVRAALSKRKGTKTCERNTENPEKAYFPLLQRVVTWPGVLATGSTEAAAELWLLWNPQGPSCTPQKIATAPGQQLQHGQDALDFRVMCWGWMLEVKGGTGEIGT